MSKASFTNLTTDLDVIQKLDDLPNAVGGLSAADLKAKFDEAANAIKDYINAVLLAQLQAETSGTAGANRIGISGIVGLTGTNNVQDALAAIYAAAQEAQAGTILNKSITAEKLADDAIETPLIKDSAVTKQKIAAGAVDNGKCDFSAGLTVVGDLTQQGKIVLDSDCYGDTLPAAGTPGRLFFLKVQ
jgi:hypothetical protein